jgi:hypothetical protein
MTGESSGYLSGVRQAILFGAIGEGGGGVALLPAIFAANFPEAS